jgi:hypothetical protein
MRKLLNSFLVGADPEFAVLKGDGLVIVKPLPQPKEGVGDIGQDHGGRVLELHPIQTRGVVALVKRMRDLFPTMKQWDSNELKFKAGAICKSVQIEDALGGHIHFGFTRAEMCGSQGGMEPFNAFLKKLDKFTHCLERLDLLPEKESERRRAVSDYGRPSAYRSSGVDNHLEYRTMASWLSSPELAFVCITGAKMIAVNPKGDVPIPGTISKNKLVEFFEQYKEDTNALRCLERVLPSLHETDPTLDIREAWNKPLSFI